MDPRDVTPDHRRPAPDQRAVATTIAGSDAGGGAGIQADLKTMAARGVFPTSVLTAVTAQNTRGVESTHVLPPQEVEAQIDAVFEDFGVGAVKTGMLAVAPTVEAVADRLAERSLHVVVDPVMVAESGDRLLDEAAERAYESLIAEACLVTPNAAEARTLTGIDPSEEGGPERAGQRLVEMGADAALVTGGHLPGESVTDVLVTEDDARQFSHPRVETDATHGSGCTLSAAVAAELAQGASIEAAVEAATDHLQRAVRYHLAVGEGPGAVHHAVELRDRAARDRTAEAVESVVDALVDADISPLVPEVGTNVVGATPYAERPDEIAAVEGRITPTLAGVASTRGVRLGASSHVARFLVAAREFDPELRFACNLKNDRRVADALAALDWPVGGYDRREQPDSVASEDGNTMQWGAREAFQSVESTPLAVTDPGAHGKEPMTKLLAETPGELVELVEGLLGELRGT